MGSSRAYTLLIDELAASRAAITATLREHSQLTDDQCVALVATFHTVRGGAGFFGLKEIAEIARQIESLLSNPREVSRERLEQLAEQFSCAFAALEDPSKTSERRGDDA